MTWFANFRTAAFRGSVHDDGVLGQTRPGNLDASSLFELPSSEVSQEQKHILFVCHGFNVPQGKGITSAVRMEEELVKDSDHPLNTATSRFVGVLWPGDWYNVLNYPVEYRDATDCGEKLAAMIDRYFRSALSVSFASHSLGARVILSAATNVAKPVDKIILTAAAADNDVLVKQYPEACAKASQIHVLASKSDRTLKHVYPAGDAVSDVIGDTDSPFGGALGYRGPRPLQMDRMLVSAIPGKPGAPPMPHKYDHCHYFPNADIPRDKKDRKSDTVSRYIAAAFAGHQRWA